jgi:hypothetical protein
LLFVFSRRQMSVHAPEQELKYRRSAAMSKLTQFVIAISLVLLVINAIWNRTISSSWQYTIEYIPAASSADPTNVGDFLTSRIGIQAAASCAIPDFSDVLKRRGRAGWELVDTFLEMETAYPNFGDEKYHTGIKTNIRPQRLGLIFKRSTGYISILPIRGGE